MNWNETQLAYTRKQPKRAYYLCIEYLMGRTFDNALLNLGLKDQYHEGVNKLGFNLEDLVTQERDAALGNGGLGRLAACYLDSSSSQELPVWGYSLRYKYGIFQQLIAPDGSQLEAPDPWLEHLNPFEIPRYDIQYEIRFYGQAERTADGRAVWSGGQEVLALAYDVMIPGILLPQRFLFLKFNRLPPQVTEPKTPTTSVFGKANRSVGSIFRVSMVRSVIIFTLSDDVTDLVFASSFRRIISLFNYPH